MAEVEEEGGFFKSVGAVGDDDAGDFRAGELGVDFLREVPHMTGRYLGAGEAGEVDFNGGKGGEGGIVREDFFAGQGRDCAATSCVVLHGNGAAREEKYDGVHIKWTS